VVDKNGMTVRDKGRQGHKHNVYVVEFKNVYYECKYINGLWDIFRKNNLMPCRFYITTVKTIEQAKLYILFNL
tara:strand:+ start:561 stop:779 length:219 start_codon:yes stop_codon:yes gene_type:complete